MLLAYCAFGVRDELLRKAAIVYFCFVAAIGGLVLPTLLTAVITASTVHMGRNKEDRRLSSAKIESVVAQAPEYLHPV